MLPDSRVDDGGDGYRGVAAYIADEESKTKYNSIKGMTDE